MAYQNKNLKGKQLILYKENLSKQGLNQIQKDILVGTLLGDASMQAVKANEQSNVKFEQVDRQQDYINHLYEQFVDWVGTPPQIRNIQGGGAANRKSIWFKTYKHSCFAFYKNIFYKVDTEGKQYKVVPYFIHRLLTPRALAYWYMDDGTAKRNNEGKIISCVLNTQGFSYHDQKILAKALGSTFGFQVNIWKDRNSWKIAILAPSLTNFIETVKPFILPSFYYKIDWVLISTSDVDLSHPGAAKGPKG